MASAKFCDLKSGGWRPKIETGGHSVLTTQINIEPKNQLDSNAFTFDELQQIREAVRKKYAIVSSSASGFFSYPVGKEGARNLGYENRHLEQAPDYLLNSFCGEGNPFAIDQITEGSYVLDIGCGAGFDLWIASRLAGEKGRVFGVDITEGMICKAQSNLNRVQVKNSEIFLVSSEQLPFSDNIMDRVISNGVINLSPDKPRLFAEVYRVLKPWGILQFADIILEKKLPDHLATGVESWSQWIGGSIPGGDQLILMEQAGFSNVSYLGTTSVRTSDFTVGALFRAHKKLS